MLYSIDELKKKREELVKFKKTLGNINAQILGKIGFIYGLPFFPMKPIKVLTSTLPLESAIMKIIAEAPELKEYPEYHERIKRQTREFLELQQDTEDPIKTKKVLELIKQVLRRFGRESHIIDAICDNLFNQIGSGKRSIETAIDFLNFYISEDINLLLNKDTLLLEQKNDDKLCELYRNTANSLILDRLMYSKKHSIISTIESILKEIFLIDEKSYIDYLDYLDLDLFKKIMDRTVTETHELKAYARKLETNFELLSEKTQEKMRGATSKLSVVDRTTIATIASKKTKQIYDQLCANHKFFSENQYAHFLETVNNPPVGKKHTLLSIMPHMLKSLGSMLNAYRTESGEISHKKLQNDFMETMNSIFSPLGTINSEHCKRKAEAIKAKFPHKSKVDIYTSIINYKWKKILSTLLKENAIGDLAYLLNYIGKIPMESVFKLTPSQSSSFENFILFEVIGKIYEKVFNRDIEQMNAKDLQNILYLFITNKGARTPFNIKRSGSYDELRETPTDKDIENAKSFLKNIKKTKFNSIKDLSSRLNKYTERKKQFITDCHNTNRNISQLLNSSNECVKLFEQEIYSRFAEKTYSPTHRKVLNSILNLFPSIVIIVKFNAIKKAEGETGLNILPLIRYSLNEMKEHTKSEKNEKALNKILQYVGYKDFEEYTQDVEKLVEIFQNREISPSKYTEINNLADKVNSTTHGIDNVDQYIKLHNQAETLEEVGEELGINLGTGDKHPKLKELEIDIPLGNFRFRILKPFSFRHLTIGTETNCCQRIGGEGEEAAIDSFINPLAGVLILERFVDGNWELISQSYFHYVPQKNGYILDNVEYNKTNAEKLAKGELERLYKILAQEMSKKGITFFLLGKGYTKLNKKEFKTGKALKNDPRHFTVEDNYTDFDPDDHINLLKTKKSAVVEAAMLFYNLLK